MSKFRIVRALTPSIFDECEVWSEYYDFEELDEIRSWGIEEAYINELITIAREGDAHPYYPVQDTEVLPDRMRMFIRASLFSNSGVELEGVICNPAPFIIGIFVGEKIEIFNPNLAELWKENETKVKVIKNIRSDSIFPIRYTTKYKDCYGKQIEGVYSEHPMPNKSSHSAS